VLASKVQSGQRIPGVLSRRGQIRKENQRVQDREWWGQSRKGHPRSRERNRVRESSIGSGLGPQMLQQQQSNLKTARSKEESIKPSPPSFGTSKGGYKPLSTSGSKRGGSYPSK